MLEDKERAERGEKLHAMMQTDGYKIFEAELLDKLQYADYRLHSRNSAEMLHEWNARYMCLEEIKRWLYDEVDAGRESVKKYTEQQTTQAGSAVGSE